MRNIAILLLLPFCTLAQSFEFKAENGKYYVKSGKVQQSPFTGHADKGPGDKTEYLDYFDVELQGFGFGDVGQVPYQYWTFHDSAYTHIGTAFTHIYDYNTKRFYPFDSIAAKTNTEYLIIDSILFNFGHANHSGQPNTLGITLRELPANNAPSTDQTIIWADTITAVNFTPGQAIFELPVFSVTVADTLSYTNRGVYVELYFKGEAGQDSASFFANHRRSELPCQLSQSPGAIESFTLREKNLNGGRTYFKNPYQSVALGNPADQYYTNLNLFTDCNSNGVHNKDGNEAFPIQNISMGIYFTFGGQFIGLEKVASGISKLKQNYPNPFGEVTHIDYSLDHASQVIFEIRDVLGKVIVSKNQGQKNIGNHQIIFDGSSLSEGIYYYSLMTEHGRLSRKMVIKNR
ncbi:MAG: T9SS type A sorting domain-containing protein [Vicingaceae bacterium]